jgi:hypothetical protein
LVIQYDYGRACAYVQPNGEDCSLGSRNPIWALDEKTEGGAVNGHEQDLQPGEGSSVGSGRLLGGLDKKRMFGE